MFKGNRRFDGRQGEQILNEEQYLLYEILKHFLDVPTDSTAGPESNLEKAGALWLDRQSSPGYSHIMYHDSDDTWKPIFDDWFKIIKEIRSLETPLNPREGQLWINDEGIMHWFNGTKFVPIKTAMANSIDFDTNSFQNFLVLDSLKMTGGYIVDTLTKLISISGNLEEWKPNHNYNIDNLFYYNYGTLEAPNIKFFECIKNFTSSNDFKLDIPYIIYEGDEETEIATMREVNLKAQFLIPSEYLDKIFIAGQYAENKIEVDIKDLNTISTYEKLSDVCVQMSLNIFQGKLVTVVHVNPIALKNIDKKIIKIEKDKSNYNEYAMIKVDPEYTEFYGIKGAYGQLLLKNVDYMVKPNGIQLITSEDENSITAFDEFDFIYCVTYEFEQWIKTKGKLIKDTIKLSNRTSIWIGELEPDDKLLIFTNGLCLEDFYYNYDASTGFVIFNGYDINGKVTDISDNIVKPLFEGKTDVAIMRFKKKTNIGIFTPENLDNHLVNEGETELYNSYKDADGVTKYNVRIHIPKDFVKPLVFVQGPNLELTLQDYEMLDEETAIIYDAEVGAAYYVVDAVRNDGYNLYARSGVIDETLQILVDDYDLVSEEALPLIFIDGFYISNADLYYEDSRHITIEGLKEGQTYTLLKDKRNNDYQLLYDGTISFTTIPLTETIDDALVYIAGSLIIDGQSVTTVNLNTDGVVNNQVKLVNTEDGQKWYIFRNKLNENDIYVGGEWIELSDNKVLDPDNTLCTELNLSSSGYSIEHNSINILQNFGNKTCTYYAYKFCNNIEKPLIKGYSLDYIDLDNEIFYELERGHTYTLGINSLHVWINGVKQKIRETIYTKTYDNGITRDIKGYTVEKPVDYKGEPLKVMPTPFYIIEEPEEGEYKSCQFEYLTEMISKNSYYSYNSILAPGMVRVFIDGYRQPQESFIVNDINTLTLLESPITDLNNIIQINDKFNNEKFIEVKSRSTVLVEVRQDYSLKERTIQLTQNNIDECIQGNTMILSKSNIFKDDKKLLASLFLALESEINIYINGAMYGDDFTLIRNQDLIILNDSKIVRNLRKNDYITFEWR